MSDAQVGHDERHLTTRSILQGRQMQCETMCRRRLRSSTLIDVDMDGPIPASPRRCARSTEDDTSNGVKCSAAAPNTLPGSTIQGQAFLRHPGSRSAITRGPRRTRASSREAHRHASALQRRPVRTMYLAGTQISVSSAILSLPTFDVDAAKSKFEMIRVSTRKYMARRIGASIRRVKAARVRRSPRVNDF